MRSRDLSFVDRDFFFLCLCFHLLCRPPRLLPVTRTTRVHMSEYSVPYINTTRAYFDQMVRDALRRGDILHIMDVHHPAIVSMYILASDYSLTLGCYRKPSTRAV
jgi:hypothetical protein